MIISYHFEDIDYERQKNEILDIKNENAQLKTSFKEYINYINNKNKEKYILLDIFTLESDAIREFLDVFII